MMVAGHRIRSQASTLLLIVTGCWIVACGVPADSQTRAVIPAAPATLPSDPPLPPAGDSGAVLAALVTRMSTIDRDTQAMHRAERTIDLGAGAMGVLVAWRSGTVWRRLQLQGSDSTFRRLEQYWLNGSGLIAARQELARPNEQAKVDSIWFRDGKLYRWVDAERRHLNGEARSTQYEVEMLRKRLDDLLEVLAADSAQHVPLL